jgi:hypothetical protein
MTLEEALKDLENTKGVRFDDLVKIARVFFGEPRMNGSHHIFKTNWQGDPRVNIQREGKDAKSYQVKQVVKALTKLKGEQDVKKANEAKQK